MPTHNNCLAVAIAGILLVALEIGPVISQNTDVTSEEILPISPDLTVSRLSTTSPASSIPELSLTFTVATTPFVVIAPQPLTPISFTSSAESSSFDHTPSSIPTVRRVVSTTVSSTSVPSTSSSVLLSSIISTGTGVTTTLAIASSAMSEPAFPGTTRMPRLNPSFTLSSSAQFPTESPDIAMTTATSSPGPTDSGNETSFSLYVAIPLGSATFCAIFLLFACLMCIWCKRMIKMKTESIPKEEEEGVPTEMYVLENSSKGDTLRYDIQDDSTKTFGVASTLATQSSEQTPISVQTTHITPNQSMFVGDGSDKEDLRVCAVGTNPSLECSPEADAYVKLTRVSSLPRSYHLSIKHPTHQESQNPPVMMKPTRSLSSINTGERQGKRKLSSPLSGNVNMTSKVYAVPIATAGVIDQQQTDNLEQQKYTQCPTRTNSVGALYGKAAAESINPDNKENDGLYDVPRVTLLRRASDNPRTRNAVAPKFQRNMATDSEPSSHYDIPKHALARPMSPGQEILQHSADFDDIQSSEEQTSFTVPMSTSGHYDIPKKVEGSHSFSSGHKRRVIPQTAIQRHPTYPKVKQTPSIQIPRTQAVVDPFSTYDIPRKAATLPNISHTNPQGDASHYDVPRRLTAAQNNEESSKPFLSGLIHSGSSTYQPIPDQVHTMPTFGNYDPQHVQLSTNQENYLPQSANASTHDYQTVRRSPADIITNDEDSDTSSEHLYDQPPIEFLEEVRQMAKKRQTSSEAQAVPPSNPSQSNSTLKDVQAPTNRNVLQKAPPPVKQKPVGKRPAAAKQL